MSNVRRLVLSLLKVFVVFGFARPTSGAPSTTTATTWHVRTLLRRSLLIVEHGSALANRTAASGLAGRRGFERQLRSWQALPANPASPNLSVERTG